MSADLSPAPPPSGQSPQDVVDAVAAAARSSFALGIRLLPRPRREAMRAVYAYCRVVDDIADGVLPPPVKLDLLAEWKDEIARIYAGAPVSAIGQVLAGAIATHDLPQQEFLLIAEGMEIDAAGPVVAPTLDRLLHYNRRVAGAVGLLSMRVFGAWRGEVSERFALALANALQTTNILRDVEEDAEIGRVYLTAECLSAAGIDPDPAVLPGHPNLAAARACLGREAAAAFAEAERLISAHDRRALRPALAMYGVYRAYFDRMERAGWHYGPAFRMGRLAKLRHGLGAVLAA